MMHWQSSTVAPLTTMLILITKGSRFFGSRVVVRAPATLASNSLNYSKYFCHFDPIKFGLKDSSGFVVLALFFIITCDKIVYRYNKSERTRGFSDGNAA